MVKYIYSAKKNVSFYFLSCTISGCLYMHKLFVENRYDLISYNGMLYYKEALDNNIVPS